MKKQIVEFLRPTKLKCIILVVFLLVAILPLTLISSLDLYSGYLPSKYKNTIIPFFAPGISLPPSCSIKVYSDPGPGWIEEKFSYDECIRFNFGTKHFESYNDIHLSSWIYNIVYWYLLSCLIIFAYDKFKSRKKSKRR